MNTYSTADHEANREKILAALDAIQQLYDHYKDVIAIPEIITLHDITEYRLEIDGEVKQFKTVFDKNAAKFVLEYLHNDDCITPEQFENTVVQALKHYCSPKK